MISANIIPRTCIISNMFRQNLNSLSSAKSSSNYMELIYDGSIRLIFHDLSRDMVHGFLLTGLPCLPASFVPGTMMKQFE